MVSSGGSDYSYIGAAIFFVGVGWAAAKFTRRMMLESSDLDQPVMSGTTYVTNAENDSVVKYLIENRLMSAEHFSAMSDHDRAMLVMTTAQQIAAKNALPKGEHELPHSGQVKGPALLVHCPSCGTPLTKDPYPVPFIADCPSCARRISVRGDGPGRLGIVMMEPRHHEESAPPQPPVVPPSAPPPAS